MWIVTIKGNGGCRWVFTDFEGGTQEEAEDCADFMNRYSDSARDFGWIYYAEEEM